MTPESWLKLSTFLCIPVVLRILGARVTHVEADATRVNYSERRCVRVPMVDGRDPMTLDDCRFLVRRVSTRGQLQQLPAHSSTTAFEGQPGGHGVVIARKPQQYTPPNAQ